MHTAKWTQEITHACPEIFNRIDMYLAHTIAIVIPRPFALPMRDSRMLSLQARIAAPFIRIHIRTWTCKSLHMQAKGFPISMFHDPQAACYADIPAKVCADEWVVHCKPVGRGETALKYLAPYIFRVALSNRRLVKLENERVTFRHKESKTGQTKFCTLPAEQFIHRFLQHMLPKSFVKVRAYGLFSRSGRKRLVALQQQLRQAQSAMTSDPPQPSQPAQAADPSRLNSASDEAIPCPVCGRAMHRQLIPRPAERCPP